MPAAEVPGIFCRAIQHSFPAVTSFVDIHRAETVPRPPVIGIPAISFHEAAEVIMSAAVADDLATVRKAPFKVSFEVNGKCLKVVRAYGARVIESVSGIHF